MLTVILGGMFSGKTQYVIREARRYKAIGKRVIFVNSILDNRYGKKEHVVSHDGTSERCISYSFLQDISSSSDISLYNSSELVIIEEAQFFPDLYTFLEQELKNNMEKEACERKEFLVSGLSGDSNMKPIGQMLHLLPIADHVVKLNGLCSICKDGTVGPFTKRIVDTTEQILVGGKESYACVCRKHHGTK